MNLIDIPTPVIVQLQQGSPEWLAYRRAKRNASESAAVMGASPWMTPYQLWLAKTGKQETTVTQAMQRGTDLEPLARALKGQKAWITGLRQEQSTARAEVPLLDESEVATKALYKFNPLANWTWGDVWHYIATNQVDYNPLHDQFFPSIGCAPCTRAISLGEEFRAGRWWWEDETAKECGLHVKK